MRDGWVVLSTNQIYSRQGQTLTWVLQRLCAHDAIMNNDPIWGTSFFFFGGLLFDLGVYWDRGLDLDLNFTISPAWLKKYTNQKEVYNFNSYSLHHVSVHCAMQLAVHELGL